MPHLCHYCGRELSQKKATKDHVIPRSRGGVNEQWNIVISCSPCNLTKGSDWPTCQCNFCRRSRRRHRDLGVTEDTPFPKEGKKT
jgi:hypothetical protein